MYYCSELLFPIFRYNISTPQRYHRLVHDNFLSLDVYIEGFGITYMVNRPKISFMDFVSQLGAALNLWAGIQIMIIIEIVEVIIRMGIDRWTVKKTMKPASENQPDGVNIITHTTRFWACLKL